MLHWLKPQGYGDEWIEPVKEFVRIEMCNLKNVKRLSAMLHHTDVITLVMVGKVQWSKLLTPWVQRTKFAFKVHLPLIYLRNINSNSPTSMYKLTKILKFKTSFGIFIFKICWYFDYLMAYALSSKGKYRRLQHIMCFLFLAMYLSFTRKQLAIHRTRRSWLNNNLGNTPPKNMGFRYSKRAQKLLPGEYIFTFYLNFFERKW